MSELVYVLPVHNEEAILEANVERLATYLERLGSGLIYLVENGSSDRSWEIAERLAAESKAVPIRAFREPAAGIGHAYHRGLTEALAEIGASEKRWAVLTAADLPFGFSDIEAALVLFERAPSRIFMGSKAHPSSVVKRSAGRRVMSAAYRLARRATLGMQVGDSQGSVLLRLDLAAVLAPQVTSRDFFYSTELCHYAERAGESIIELPIVLEEAKRASTVKPVKNSAEMARKLWELRARSRKKAPTE